MQNATSPRPLSIVSPGHSVAHISPRSENRLPSPNGSSVDLTLPPSSTESKITPDKTYRPDKSRDREKSERRRDRDREDKEGNRSYKERDRDRDRDRDDKDRERDRERNYTTDKYESYSKYNRDYDRYDDKDRYRSRKRRSSPYD